MRVEWSAEAVSDLRLISERIEVDRNVGTANRIYGRVDHTRELIIAGLPWLVVYSVEEKRILVLSILHGAQRWP